MKNYLSLRLGVAVVMFAGRLFAGTGDNLVGTNNPGFENVLSQWGGSGFANGSVDSANPGSGSWSGKLAAAPGNPWNVLVNTGGTASVTQGNCYVVSALCRNNLTGGVASLGLNEMTSGMVSTDYTWRTTVNTVDWHREYLTLVPRADTAFIRIYLWNASGVTSGASWWDNLHLDTFPNPFLSDANASIQVTLPTLVFNHNGSVISPATLQPVAKLGARLAGGILSWRLVRETDGIAGAPLLQDAFAIAQAGVWQWPVNMSQLASLGEGRYLFTVTTTTADGSETGTITKPLAVVSNISTMNSASPSPVTSSTIDANGRFLLNGQPFQIVLYYGIYSGNAVDYDKVRSLGGNSIQLTGNSLSMLSANIDLAWSHNLYSWVVLQQPPFTQSAGGVLGPTTTWDLAYLKATLNVLKSKPGVIGYYLVDEPDGLAIPASQVQSAYNAIKAADCDPNHAVWVNFVSNPTKTINYPNCSDFASYDSYPFPLGSLSVINSSNTLMKNLYPSKPLIGVLQGFSVNGFPSFSQLRAELYTNVCDGGAHPLYFAWHSEPYNCLVNKPEMLAYTQLLNWEMKQLQPFLFSSGAFLSVTVNNPHVRAVAKNVGTKVILVLVNQSDEPVEGVQAAVSGVSFSSGSAFFPGTSPGTLSAGKLVDNLPSYGVGIYQLQ